MARVLAGTSSAMAAGRPSGERESARYRSEGDLGRPPASGFVPEPDPEWISIGNELTYRGIRSWQIEFLRSDIMEYVTYLADGGTPFRPHYSNGETLRTIVSAALFAVTLCRSSIWKEDTRLISSSNHESERKRKYIG